MCEEPEQKEMVILEWNFTPADYFEEPINLLRDNYEINIEDGRARANIEAKHFDSNPDLRTKIHESLNSRFQAAQIINRKTYELSESSMSRIHENGAVSQTIFVKAAELIVTANSPDIVITESNGEVAGDSKRERIAKREALANLVEKHSPGNPTIKSIMASWETSLREPDNVLSSLYDIREALKREFGNENAAYSALGLSRKSWKELGRLANYEPLKQGRHPGWHANELRDATEDELIQARRIAQTLIEQYLDYLERKG